MKVVMETGHKTSAECFSAAAAAAAAVCGNVVRQCACQCAELKQVTESFTALAKSQMEYVNDKYLRTEEMVRRYATIRTLESNMERVKVQGGQQLQRLHDLTKEVERLVNRLLILHFYCNDAQNRRVWLYIHRVSCILEFILICSLLWFLFQ